MYDYLINHATTNVWCTPDQDQQVVFAPARISGPRGAIGTCPVAWENLPMPDATHSYHVYQIGQVSPGLLNLLPDVGIWRLVAENMKDNNVICDVYTINGIQLPRIETYILVNRDRNVLLAIRDQKPLIDLTATGNQLFFRLYSNAYFFSARETPTSTMVDIYGARVTSQAQILSLQHKYQQLQALPGLVTAFVNGMFVDMFNPFVVPLGQVVEFVYDSTVKRVVEFPIANLNTFNSILDAKRKYLLHYAGQGDSIIDYQDDIDVYLINRNQAGPVPAFKGVYYHKNAVDAVRMVTHKDYAIVVPYVTGYATNVPGWSDPTQLTVRLHIRNSGYARPLVNEISRIADLYRLPDSRVTAAMLGVDSSMTQWQAANLENSPYTKIMRLDNASDINIDLVQQAYGYDAISKILGDGPITVSSDGGVLYINVPFGLQLNSTMFEYDSSGVLLGFYQHPVGYVYQVYNANCAWVEPISGAGSSFLSTNHDGANQVLNPVQSYRFYKCLLVNGAPTSEWIDVTNDNTAYSIVNNLVVWHVDQSQYVTAVRDDLNFLAYQYTVTPTNGFFSFTVASTEKWNGTLLNGVMYIPPGDLTLYLNGRVMIEGLDYLVQWPQICIVNKAFLNYNSDGSVGSQVVTIRGTGFCNKDLSRNLPIDKGFSEYDVLSRNGFFNIREDKVLRIAVNGGIYPRSVVKFSEDNPSTGMANFVNGVPYSITEVIVPTTNNCDKDTYALYGIDKPIDTAVENYLTQYLQDTAESLPDVIPDVYAIYSPFTAKLMYDLLNGVFDITPWMGQYSDMAVKNALTAYLPLLKYEPTLLPLDLNHVIVHPHDRMTVVTLNIYQYNFLARAVKVYLNDAVDLSHFISILNTYI